MQPASASSPVRLWSAVIALVAAVAVPVMLALWLAPPPPPGPGQQPLPDFTAIEDANERKQRFFDYLRPIVEQVNAELLEQRERLDRIDDQRQARGEIAQRDRRWLARVADHYGVDAENPADALAELRRRIDVIPPALALAQAAIESGWGRSRFAREGNNLFGEWCFHEGCGMVPAARPAGARHEVRIFISVGDAVRSYAHNLNSHRAYTEMRAIRARIRAEDREPTGRELAAGLQRYSARGQVYVDEVRGLIRSNELE